MNSFNKLMCTIIIFNVLGGNDGILSYRSTRSTELQIVKLANLVLMLNILAKGKRQYCGIAVGEIASELYGD